MRGSIIDKVYFKNEKERGKLKNFGKKGSWTINLDEVSKMAMITGEVEYLIFTTKKSRYLIKAKIALAHGFFRYFNGEAKWVIGIEWWKKLAIEDQRPVEEVFQEEMCRCGCGKYLRECEIGQQNEM